MTGEELKQWRTGIGISKAGLARALGLDYRTIAIWERGFRKSGIDGVVRPVTVPKYIELACAAIAHNVRIM